MDLQAMETPDVKLNSGAILVSSRSLIAIWPGIHTYEH